MKGPAQTNQDPSGLLITVEEAARRLSIGRSHVYAQMQRGNLRSVRIGRSRRILARDLEGFIQVLLGDPEDAQRSDETPCRRQPVKSLPKRSGRR